MSPSTTKPEAIDDLMSTYLRQWKMLRGVLKKRTGSHDLAEDAMQETWVRLATTKASPVDIIDQQAFILRVANNIATDLLRKERRHSSRCIGDEVVLQAIADNCPSPEIFVIDRDQLRHLSLALMKLPIKPRKALLLSRCDGLTHAQVAKKLAVSESMVARYLVQALRHCRDYFREL